ncbi:MAG TPA: hypothetical protein VKB54_04835 [Solirubrobacteraceae bacterium]|nr:hypothetical protein [Solirubrobacteraceae bacterium]
MRATPLTILSPVPWWWACWIRFSWLFARYVPWVTRPLQELSFIHFARWSVIGRWPADRQTRRDRAAPRALLFLTSFDGSDIQYIEAFVRVVPKQIGFLYLFAKDFPGPRRFGPVKRYIDDHTHPVGHFWLAHPDASTTMVQQALELREAFTKLEPRVKGADAQTLGREWQQFLTSTQELL